MKKLGACLLACLQVTICMENLSAAPGQTITAQTVPTTVTITSNPPTPPPNGSTDGVALTAQNPSPSNNEITLIVPDTIPINSNGVNASAVSTNTNHVGNVTFLGSSVVTGSMGAPIPGNSLDSITGGASGSIVTFNGTVNAATITFAGTGTMNFNGTTNAALSYDGNNGIAQLGAGQTFTGDASPVTNFKGTLNLAASSNPAAPTVFNGFVGTPPTVIFNPPNPPINVPPVFFGTIGVTGGPGSALITLSVWNQTFNLDLNTLNIGNSLTFATSPVINLTTQSDTNHGMINVGAIVSFPNDGSNLTVNAHVPLNASFSGNPIAIVEGGAGGTGPITSPTTGIPVVVTSDLPRIKFTGENPVNMGGVNSGRVFITPSIVPAPIPPGPGQCIASAFENAALGATGDLAAVQAILNALSIIDPTLKLVGAAEAQMAPIVNGDTVAMSFEAINQFQNLWSNNLVRARAVNICYNPSNLCDLVRGDDCCGFREELPWNGEGVWLDTFGYFPDQKKRHDILGYDADMYGVMLAVQRPLCNDVQVGIGGGYAHTKIRGKGDPAAGFAFNGNKINTGDATLYLGYSPGCWYVDTFLSGAWNRYEGFRHITFPGLDHVANSKYNGQEYAALISTGYLFSCNCFNITPIASLQYAHLHLDGYTETGDGLGSSLNLRQKSQQYDTLQTGLGLMVGYSLDTCLGLLYLEAHSKWLYNCIDYRIRNLASLTSIPCTCCTTNGVTAGRSILETGIGATLFTCGNFGLNATYEFTYREDFTAHEATLSAVYRF